MKFCYIDESGKGDESVLVLAGVLADAKRMHVTKREWREILQKLSKILDKPVAELHTRHLYRGRGLWSGMDGTQRAELIELLIGWMHERKHHLYFSAIDKEMANTLDVAEPRALRHKKGALNYWMMAALHMLLVVQKVNQGVKAMKGHAVVVFDKGVDEEQIAGLAVSPPEWTDSFYAYAPILGKGKRQRENPDPRLSHIIDSPYFADSKHAPLLQVADLFAYILRHYAELKLGRVPEGYNGELAKVESWCRDLSPFLLTDASRWPKTGACDCAKLYREIAPEPLQEIKKRFL